VEWDFVVWSIGVGGSKVEVIIMVWCFVVEVVSDIMMEVMVVVWVVTFVMLVVVVEVRLRMVGRSEETVKPLLAFGNLIVKVSVEIGVLVVGPMLVAMSPVTIVEVVSSECK